jgi:hypothetical protein
VGARSPDSITSRTPQDSWISPPEHIPLGEPLVVVSHALDANRAEGELIYTHVAPTYCPAAFVPPSSKGPKVLPLQIEREHEDPDLRAKEPNVVRCRSTARWRIGRKRASEEARKGGAHRYRLVVSAVDGPLLAVLLGPSRFASITERRATRAHRDDGTSGSAHRTHWRGRLAS